jgi:hypothetical protein
LSPEHWRIGCVFSDVNKGETNMPATSKAQQKAAGAALSAKRGDTKKSQLKGVEGNVRIHERKAARGLR